MNIIVAVDRNRGIGRDGSLLFSIPEDKKFVRRMTTGKVIVMGRSTFLSLPGGKPLKDRVNIVLTRDGGFAAEGAVICHSLEELGETLKEYGTDDVFVFGGQAIYEELIGYCKYAYVTKVDAAAQADRFFPDIDALPSWRLAETLACGTHEGISYSIARYENENPEALSSN